MTDPPPPSLRLALTLADCGSPASGHHAPPLRRLARLLKAIKRSYGFFCVSLEVVPPTATAATERQPASPPTAHTTTEAAVEKLARLLHATASNWITVRPEIAWRFSPEGQPFDLLPVWHQELYHHVARKVLKALGH